MKKAIKKISGAVSLLMLSAYTTLAIDDSKITTAAENLKTTTLKVVQTLSTVVLAIGLIIMIYKVATSDQRSREWVIGWVLAAILFGIGMTIIK